MRGDEEQFSISKEAHSIDKWVFILKNYQKIFHPHFAPSQPVLLSNNVHALKSLLFVQHEYLT